MMQGLFALIVNVPALCVVIYSNSESLSWFDYLGVAVWAFGFAFECIGDEQLRRHLAD